MPTTTFSTTAKGAAVTLSGGNLTGTVTSGTGSVQAARQISGLTYGEWVIGATLTGSARVGLCNPAFAFTGLLGVDLNGIGYDSGGTVKINNLTVATIAAYAVGNNVSWAFNPQLQLIWFRVNGGNWNNDVIGNQNPVGAVGGISTTTAGGNFAAAWGGSATSSVTAQFATASFTYTPPTGFVTLETIQCAGTSGAVASTAAAFTTYGAAKSSTVSQFSVRAPRAGPVNMTPGSTTTVSGQAKVLGVATAGLRVALFDEADPTVCLGITTSDGSGNWSIPALGRPSCFAVCLDDPTYQAVVVSNVVPI